MLWPLSLPAQERLPVGVAQFKVNGPDNLQYLGGAAQDAIVGSLLQKGYSVRPLKKSMGPEELKRVKKGKDQPGLVIAGQITAVGNTYRVRVKWLDIYDRSSDEYIQVQSLDELLPKLEQFAAKEIQPPVVQLTAKELKKEEKKERELAKQDEGAASPQAPVVEVAKSDLPQAKESVIPPEIKELAKESAFPPEPAAKTPPEEPKKMVKDLQEAPKHIRGYDFISRRLPFDVRGLAYGDVTGNGENEVILTSKNKIHLYRFKDGDLDLLAEYSGGKLDYFVKVDLFPQSTGPGTLVALTNLRETQALSKILKYSGGQFIPVAENIPFQLRVVKMEGKHQLLGAPYNAKNPALHNIVLLSYGADGVKAVQKMDLPAGTHLYNYNWVSGPKGDGKPVLAMTPLGKLRYYENNGKKYKKVWSSKESYGGSGNYIPVKIKNFFNEVIGDYYALPVGILSLGNSQTPEVVVAKNDSLVKNVIGRVPVIADGRLFRLKYDQMGFVETWESKKVDGSIQDYLVTSSDGQSKLLAAVRLRSPGLFGDFGPKRSVLLIYNLN